MGKLNSERGGVVDVNLKRGLTVGNDGLTFNTSVETDHLMWWRLFHTR